VVARESTGVTRARAWHCLCSTDLRGSRLARQLDTSPPLVAGARQAKRRVGKRVRITCWVDGQPGRRQPRITLNDAGGAAPLAGREDGILAGLAKAPRSRRIARQPPDATHARPRNISGLAAPTAAFGAAALRDPPRGSRRTFRRSRHTVRELG